MTARTRSDILAASSGYASPLAATALYTAANKTDVGMRVLLDALEFAIDHARGEDDIEILRRENEALWADVQALTDAASRGTHGAR